MVSYLNTVAIFKASWQTGVISPTYGLNIPVIQEEAILEENINGEVDKAFHSHAEEVLPKKVPVVRVGAVVFTWGAGHRFAF